MEMKIHTIQLYTLEKNISSLNREHRRANKKEERTALTIHKITIYREQRERKTKKHRIRFPFVVHFRFHLIEKNCQCEF